MSKIKYNLLATAFGLAITLTLGCPHTSDDGGGGGTGDGSNLSDLPKQAYLVVWDADYNNIVTKEKYNGNGDITLRIGGKSANAKEAAAGKIQNGQISLNLPDITSEYLTNFSFTGVSSPENLTWYPAVDDRREPSVTIPGKNGCWLHLGLIGANEGLGFLSYFSKSGKITGRGGLCRDGVCEKYMSFDLNISKGWNVVYITYSNDNDDESFYTDLSKTGGTLEWWIGCDND
ncbi:hypothetical protein R83H12_00033 [Fibrobacteria bacterium R8-3-H12]